MACMCGDAMCASCGPAQGYNPEFEAFCEWLDDKFGSKLPECIDKEWFGEYLAHRFDELTPAELQSPVSHLARPLPGKNYHG